MKKELVQVLSYFLIFDYPPSLDEIYTFFPKRISKNKLSKELSKIVFKNKSIEPYSNLRFTIDRSKNRVVEYSIKTVKSEELRVRSYEERYQSSLKKIDKVRFYIRLLSFFPQIKLIGLSGGVAMLNAEENDDIDIFIITAKHRLWTGRLIAVLLAQILGIRRSRLLDGKKLVIKDKICLNLFFDETNLKVSKRKQTVYVGHEILQMKLFVNKDMIYERFLDANRWIMKFFPNSNILRASLRFGGESRSISYCNNRSRQARTVIRSFKSIIPNIIGNISESIMKKIQLWLIKKHQANEIITNNQLWFFPEDFEKKIRARLIDQSPEK